jgi:outer membrane protein OmpA-like peptidoglycan-associated protein
VSRGIASDRVTSQGFGSSRSVADNSSAEGRANNRRVEIVVAPKAP